MNDLVRVTAATHPFKAETKNLQLPEGLTVNQMLELTDPGQHALDFAVVFIKGEIVPKDQWDVFIPKSGMLVEVRAFPIPRGGGDGGSKDPLRIILTIAVIAFAAWAGPALAGMFFTSAAIEAGGAFVTFSIAALQGLTATVGMLAVNAIAPVRPNSLGALSGTDGRDSPTLFIEGARNALRPFSPVPVVLGQYRVTPPLGSKPYTEIIGDKQFVRMLFVWGIGPLSIDVDSIKIGETPITEFEGVQIEHREGYSDDEPLTLFPSAINQDDFSVLLTQAAGWISRTGRTNSDEISVDFTFPNGLVTFDDNGKRSARSVNIEIEYRKEGEVDWLKIDTLNDKFQTTAASSWLNKSGSNLTSITFNQNKTSSIRHGIRWGVSERGQYEVRMRRVTADTESTQIYDTVVWSCLRSITDQDPINMPVPVAVTALIIQASDQLNGIVDDLNGMATSVCLDWDHDTETWIERESQNPASIYRHALQGNGMSEPLSDSRIDLEKLQYWHEFCDLHGFKFNMVRDFTASVWDTLADIAAAGRAAPTQIDGKWSVVIEEVKEYPVSHITPRNSFDFKAEKYFLNLPHGWRVRFPNENQGFEYDERRVYRDGYSDENATKFESLELPGVTDPDQVYQLGRFRIIQAANQPERWTFKQDMEYLTYKRGDRVLITHDVLLVGLAYGRIKDVILSDASVVGLVLDEEVTMEAGKEYGISIRTLGHAQRTATVIPEVGSTKILTLLHPIAGEGSPAVAVVSAGDLFGFGLLGQETDDASILSIMPDADLQAQITAVPYRESSFAPDGEEIPEFETNLTPLLSIPAPSIRSVVSDESAISLGPGDTLKVRIGIDFDPLDRNVFGEETDLRIQMRPSTTGESFSNAEIDVQDSNHIYLSGVRTGETWDIRMRFVVPGRLPGPWAYVYNHLVIGKSTPPSPLTGMTISVFGAQALIRWDRPSEMDVMFGGEVVFRHSPSLTDPKWPESVTIGNSARARTLYTVLPLKEGSYLARVYDVAGNQSEEITVVSTKQASIHTFVSVDTLDEAPDFLGDHDGTVVDSGSLSIDSGSPEVLEGIYKFAQGVDLVTVQKVRVTTRMAVTIFEVADEIDGRLDPIDSWADFDGGLSASADARIYARHTDDDPEGSPVNWSDWERIDSAEFDCRAFEFYVHLTRESADYNILVSELGIDIDEIS